MQHVASDKHDIYRRSWNNSNSTPSIAQQHLQRRGPASHYAVFERSGVHANSTAPEQLDMHNNLTSKFWSGNYPHSVRASCKLLMRIIGTIIVVTVSVLLVQHLFGGSESSVALSKHDVEGSHLARKYSSKKPNPADLSRPDSHYTSYNEAQSQQNLIHESSSNEPSSKGSQMIESGSEPLPTKQRIVELAKDRMVSLKAGEDQYVVVFDAGSTGTRVHIYQFCLRDDGGVQLVQEVFKKQGPGLSEFDDDPQHGAASLQPLIDLALQTVPKAQHNSTPLVFKATAGFRLLEAGEANSLLNQVRERLTSTTTFSFDPQDVAVIGGVEEGILGWITINYLLDRKLTDSATAVDLGGASVQVTFETSSMNNYFANDLYHLKFLGRDFLLYTHSYLGLGLKAARLAILSQVDNGTRMGYCLPVRYAGTLTFGDVTYNIRGPNAEATNECWNQVGDFLSRVSIKPVEAGKEIYLFSFFHDILQWAGFIAEDETEKIVAVNDIYKLGEIACTNPEPSDPFLCQDLVYITRLLNDKLQLSESPLHVVTHINTGETSWALGAGLTALADVGSW